MRLLSWNILADSLMSNNFKLYHLCDRSALPEAIRLHRTLEALVNLRADVIGLQEVERSCFQDYLAPRLATHGYRGVYKKRTANQMDGVAIFYNTAKLELLHAEAIEHRTLAEGVRDVGLADKMRKHNVSIVLVMRDRMVPQRRLIASCSHILWNPNRGLVKLRQIIHVMQRFALSLEHTKHVLFFF